MHSWDLSVGVDGPGARLVVFTSGCPLRCLYCQNPDTWVREQGGKPTPASEIEPLMLRYRHIKAGTDAGHRALTGRPIGPTLAFAQRLARRTQPTWVRYVLVPGHNDDERELDAFIATVTRLSNVERVEILPFHKLGAFKYEQLGIDFPLADAPFTSAKLIQCVREGMRASGLPVP